MSRSAAKFIAAVEKAEANILPLEEDCFSLALGKSPGVSLKNYSFVKLPPEELDEPLRKLNLDCYATLRDDDGVSSIFGFVVDGDNPFHPYMVLRELRHLRFYLHGDRQYFGLPTFLKVTPAEQARFEQARIPCLLAAGILLRLGIATARKLGNDSNTEVPAADRPILHAKISEAEMTELRETGQVKRLVEGGVEMGTPLHSRLTPELLGQLNLLRGEKIQSVEVTDAVSEVIVALEARRKKPRPIPPDPLRELKIELGGLSLLASGLPEAETVEIEQAEDLILRNVSFADDLFHLEIESRIKHFRVPALFIGIFGDL